MCNKLHKTAPSLPDIISIINKISITMTIMIFIVIKSCLQQVCTANLNKTLTFIYYYIIVIIIIITIIIIIIIIIINKFYLWPVRTADSVKSILILNVKAHQSDDTQWSRFVPSAP